MTLQNEPLSQCAWFSLETPLLFANQIAPKLTTLVLIGKGTLIPIDIRS